MLDPGHRAAAAAAWFGLAAGHVVRVDPVALFIGAALASATSSNDYSPDIDQRGVLARLIPGGHRGPLHMPELVGALCWILVWLTQSHGYGWIGWAVTAGFGSHLFVDMWFGKIPFLLLGGRRVGLSFDTGGVTEQVATHLLRVAAVGLLGLLCAPLLVALWSGS